MKTKRISPGYWLDRTNQKHFIDELIKKYNINCMEDWYKLLAADVPSLILKQYNYSCAQFLASYFPNYDWCDWKFSCAPRGFWKSKDNHSRYMNWLGNQLGYTDPENWYTVSFNDFKSNYGASFLQSYDGSPIKAVISHFPDQIWYEWLFKSVPKNFWKSKDNHSRYMNWLGNQLGYTDPEDWYNATMENFYNNHGEVFLLHYGNCMTDAIMSHFPNHPWCIWLFKVASSRVWKKSSHRGYMDWLGQKLNYTKIEDWYNVSQKDFYENKGSGLLTNYYHSSPSEFVIKNFPEKKWDIWMFRCVPVGCWLDRNNHRSYMDWLGQQLHYTKMEDWYGVSYTDFQNNNGGGFINHYNSPHKAVIKVYPEYAWDIEKFYHNRKAQKKLYNIIKEKYHDVKWNYKHPNLRFSKSNFKMELDVYVLSIELAIEHQGHQHFFPIDYFGGEPAFKDLQKRDAEKREACKNFGIKLVEVHYTWDGSKDALLKQVNEVLNNHAQL